MSALGTFGKIAGVVAFPVVFGGCCGGGGLLFLGSGTLAAVGGWLGGGGFVATVILALVAAYIVRAIIRPRPKYGLRSEMDN